MKDKIYKKIIWLGVALIVIFTPIARGTVRIWAIAPTLFVIYTLMLIWLLRMSAAGKGSHTAQRTPIDAPVFIFVLLSISSSIFSVYKHDSFTALLELFAYVGLFYLLVNNFDDHAMKRILRLAVYTASGLSLYGILQYIGVLPHKWWMPQEFLASTYVNHNHFAGYLELVIPLAIGMLIAHRQMKSVLMLLLTVMMVAFILSQSRGAWICLAVSLAAMVSVLVRKHAVVLKSAFVFFWIIVLIILMVVANKSIISQRMEYAAGRGDSEASLEVRLAIWRSAAKMIAANPAIGTGIGTFDHAFNRYRSVTLNSIRAQFAHNDYLQAACESGILTPLAMLWILCTVIGIGFVKEAAHPVTLGLSTGILSIALHGMVDFNFHITANMLLFIIFAAAVVIRHNDRTAADKDR